MKVWWVVVAFHPKCCMEGMGRNEVVRWGSNVSRSDAIIIYYRPQFLPIHFLNSLSLSAHIHTYIGMLGIINFQLTINWDKQGSRPWIRRGWKGDEWSVIFPENATS